MIINYIFVALLAWGLFGLLSILEKFLLDKPIHNAAAYTFYTGVFSLFTMLIFAPFMRFQSLQHVLFDLSCGMIFLIGQYCLFTAILQDEVSRVVPITGALTPIFSLIVVNYGLHMGLNRFQMIAFSLLVLGTFLISYKHGKISKKLWWPILASFFMGVYFSLVKGAYTPFAANYAWVRMGSLIGAFFMLVHPDARAAVLKLTSKIKRSRSGEKTSGLFISKEVIGGLGFIILNYAIGIKNSNPAIVNSLQGFEFAVVFAFALVISKYFPKILKEKTTRAEVFQKTLAIVILFIGLIILETH